MTGAAQTACQSEQRAKPGSTNWQGLCVAHFRGQHDTRIGTGEDYSTVSLREIFEMVPGAVDKRHSPAIIPSLYNDHDAREHARQRAVGQFIALTGDVDKGDHSLDRITALVAAFAGEAAHLIYSSAHAQPGDMRWRIIIPLARPLLFSEWHDAQLAFYSHMEAAGVTMDHALARAAQPVYLPNVPTVHAKTGTPLRSNDGTPLYYQRMSVGHPLSVGAEVGEAKVAIGVGAN